MTNSLQDEAAPARAAARPTLLFHDGLEDNRPYRAAIDRAIAEVLDGGRYILGTQGEAFERELAAYCGTAHAIGVGNGLEALGLVFEGYKTLGKIREGDEVLVPANSFVASALAVSRAGLVPAFCDVDASTHNIGEETLRAALTPRTKAVLAVHLYGRICDMAMVTRFAAEHGLLVVEDAAQAIGARWQGRAAGSLGGAAAFSFYPTKSLGALGDGGAITTSDAELAQLLRALRNYGGVEKYHHEHRGTNTRLDEIQAAVLRVKLPHLDRAIERKRAIARRYAAAFAATSLQPPSLPSDASNHSWHLFVARTARRDEFVARMRADDIVCGVHYPAPIHHQPAYAASRQVPLPEAERASREVVSLPMGASLIDADVERVIGAAHDALRRA